MGEISRTKRKEEKKKKKDKMDAIHKKIMCGFDV